MKNVLNNKRNRWLAAGLVLGVVLLYYGLGLALWGNAQVDNYNLGLQAYTQGDLPHAAAYFDRSISAYKQAQHRDWIERFVYPKPDRELAAQANFQKAKVLIRAQQMPAAVDALKESLMLNPGNVFPDGTTLADAQRMRAEAKVVKYDLELLFKANPQLAQAQGKGQGQQGQQGQQGNQQVPGTEPGKQPGKGNRDDI
jgi:tetratricopeptide (TPR) repeat protein